MLFKKKEFSIDLETGEIIDTSVIDCYGGGKGKTTYLPSPQQQQQAPVVAPIQPIVQEASVELDADEKETNKEKKQNTNKGSLKVPLTVSEKAGLNTGSNINSSTGSGLNI